MLDGLLQRMSGVLKRYGVDPRELSQEQLYKLALILQLMQAQEKTGSLSVISNRQLIEILSPLSLLLHITVGL